MAFNKMDPFCKLQYREQSFKTKVLQGAGKTPTWDETFEIDVKYIGDDLKLEVMDEDVTSSDTVGIATIKLSALISDGGIDEWFEIQYKGKSAGKIHLISHFTPLALSETKPQ
jgi:Ca2+-dependent lipid-binding protein